jgi:hypothetical protein
MAFTAVCVGRLVRFLRLKTEGKNMIGRILGLILSTALVAVLGVGVAWSVAAGPPIGEGVSDSVADTIRGGACMNSETVPPTCVDATDIDANCKARTYFNFSGMGNWTPENDGYCGFGDDPKTCQSVTISRLVCVDTAPVATGN